MVVLVTGAAGQLGQSLQFIAARYPQCEFVFRASADLDITNVAQVAKAFAQHQPNYCINAAAYTAVDKAETETGKAQAINVQGAKNLAEACRENHCILLHVSTDFVFDGKHSKPYTETDIPNPAGVYGQTKLEGEKAIAAVFDRYYIIRTSWVYSQFGNNFMKTMLRLGAERESLSVVNDQIGTPTHAVDLADALLKIILSDNQQTTNNNHYGIYNFSNEGQCSWFDFAQKIFEYNHIQIDLKPIPTTAYPTPAKRPAYSVLDKSKIKSIFGLTINAWEDSLKRSISSISGN